MSETTTQGEQQALVEETAPNLAAVLTSPAGSPALSIPPNPPLEGGRGASYGKAGRYLA